MKKINKILMIVSCFLFSTITNVQAAEVKDNYMVKAGVANLQANKDGTVTIKLHNVGDTVTAFPKTHNGDAPDSPEAMEATKFVSLWKTGNFKQIPPNAAFFYTHNGKRQNSIVTITNANITKLGKTTTLDLTASPLTLVIPEGSTSVNVSDPALVVDEGGGGAW